MSDKFQKIEDDDDVGLDECFFEDSTDCIVDKSNVDGDSTTNNASVVERDVSKNENKTLIEKKDDKSNVRKRESSLQSLSPVRKVMRPMSRREAEKAERDRTRRIQEKQKLYNEIFTDKADSGSSTLKSLVLDIDRNRNPLVKVNEQFVRYLKPHQAEGIRFLYDCTIETVEQLKSGKCNSNGCILAHSMGLGKTFQVITFIHTILTNRHTKNFFKRILILVPLNVAYNWVSEFGKWFDECHIPDQITIYEMVHQKSMRDRIALLQKWFENGGIMIFTINLFAQLVTGKKNSEEGFVFVRSSPELDKYMLNPGPDLVVIDEGHLLKNEKGCLNRALSQINTSRRIILTGTPLQNNLSEYYVMVSFIKPQLLGDKNEFKTRFENHIIRGQHKDSSLEEVCTMKRRVHVLHNLLKDCIHRRGYDVLVPYLPKKFEYVINLRLSETQADLYREYVNDIAYKSSRSFLFDYSLLRLVWNHPGLLVDFYKRRKLEDNTDFDSSSLVNFHEFIQNHMIGERYWYESFLPPGEEKFDIELSTKFVLLMSILEQCEQLGDKLLIFSISLKNLDFIEKLLHQKMDKFNMNEEEEHLVYEHLVAKNEGISNQWINGLDYFRIDGSVKVEDRSDIIKKINDPKNLRARLLLISTKAGGVGVNLIGANRCVIFDVSWNPSHDLQAIFRIFRYGQTKPVYIYRFSAFGTMENKIYDRQVTKQSLFHRVLDEHQIKRHYTASELEELYKFIEPEEDLPMPTLPKDRLLADMLIKHQDIIVSYHEHDSLLENQPEENLSEEDRKSAWDDYLKEFKSKKIPVKDEKIGLPDMAQVTSNFQLGFSIKKHEDDDNGEVVEEGTEEVDDNEEDNDGDENSGDF